MKLKKRGQDEYFEEGEIVDAALRHTAADTIALSAVAKRGGTITAYYKSLAEICEEWEDAEEENENKN